MPVNTTEPLAAILAEMRKAVVPMICGRPKIEAVSIRDVLRWADRIEAAAKRMRDSYCEVIHEKDAAYDRLLVERDRAIQAAAPGNAAAKWLYRLEYHDGTCGLWYDGSGNWCFERGIGSLDDSCKTKSLPMDYDERYRQDGRSWFSSCSRKEDLLHWYSREDAKRLLSHGFVFTRYLATEYREYDQQTVFIKETCLYREEIDFESLWKEEVAPGNAAAMRGSLEAVLAKLLECAPTAEQEWPELVDRARAALERKPEENYGNAAAMREALMFLVENEAHLFKADLTNGEYDLLEAIVIKARAALAAPARNCDRTFRSADEAVGAYVTERGDGPHLGYCDAIKWALDPAKEGGEK